ncbi:unnamed protein product [Effrenium voratum]|uniref:Uncharacterized protein n=1 Tax=Effrenium voratum TaxID=2562239 RepID=A0AA36JL15_9DINO|nr:unnamed protein product [Effrenium voratum]
MGELREAKKKLSRELQQAQRGLTKSEQEVNKLTGQLSRTEQQAQQATVKKNREGEKMEEGIGRIRQKHGKVNTVLRDKMANVGQARGRLAHVQFALSMLEKGVIIEMGEENQPQEETPAPVRRRRRSVGANGEGEGGEGEGGEEGEYMEGEEFEGSEEFQEGDVFTSEMRQEFEHLREENRQLREHLADSDQRCASAVQLLQQAQEVLEHRSSANHEESSEKSFLGKENLDQPLDATMDTVSTMHSSRESPAESPNLRRCFTQPALTAQSPASTVQFPSLLAGQKPMEKPMMYAGMPPSRMVSMPGGTLPGATPGAMPGAMPGMLRPFGYQPTPFPTP